MKIFHPFPQKMSIIDLSFFFNNKRKLPILERKVRYFIRSSFSLDQFSLADSSLQMTTVGTGVMRSAVLTPALTISSDAPVADVSRAIGPATVTMTVETSVMKPKSIVPKKVSSFVKLGNLILNWYRTFGVFQRKNYIKNKCASDKNIYVALSTIMCSSPYFHSFPSFLWFLTLIPPCTLMPSAGFFASYFH